ncbi:MAG: hypothetical protein L0221_09860, partial [Chloroflexi bacterium]|nr:hypothetical protein [Chloroflexota bacterium]
MPLGHLRLPLVVVIVVIVVVVVTVVVLIVVLVAVAVVVVVVIVVIVVVVGLDPSLETGLPAHIRAQAEVAIEEADLILLVIEGMAAPTSTDH